MPIRDLNSQQVQALKRGGVTGEELRQYQLGKGTAWLEQKAQRAFQSAGISAPQANPARTGAGSSGGRHSIGGSFDLPKPVSQSSGRRSIGGIFGTNTGRHSLGGGFGGGSTAGNIVNKIFGVDNNAASRAATNIGSRVANNPNVKKQVGGIAGVLGSLMKDIATGGIMKKAPGRTGEQGGGGEIDYGGIEFPDYTYEPPEIVMRDFTDQANANVDKAFAPLFAAYAQQKADINSKGERDRAIVGGLYDKYVGQIGQAGADTQARYAGAGQERAQQGQALSGNIGNYYGAANADTAKLLEAIGGEQAAPELLQQGANEQAYQQGQAAQNTQAVQDYYGQQAQGAADQTSAYQDAARNEGVRGQANVLADVAAQLGGVGRQEAASRTEQATTALDIAQQLANRDFQMQQANVGNAMSNAQFDYQGDVGNYNAQRQNVLDQLEQDYRTSTLQLEQDKFDFEKAKAAGQGLGSGVNPTGLNAATLQLGDRLGNQAVADISRSINNVTAGSGVRPGDRDRMGNAYISMLNTAPEIAAKNGVSVAEVQNAMIQMWKESFGQSEVIPASVGGEGSFGGPGTSLGK